MRAVLRHRVHIPVTDPTHRYLLTEVADECRHSTMFAEYIKWADTTLYGRSSCSNWATATATGPCRTY